MREEPPRALLDQIAKSTEDIARAENLRLMAMKEFAARLEELERRFEELKAKGTR